MRLPFEMASGSITGRDHLGRGRVLRGRNNQDAGDFFQDAESALAMICDGCGAGARSEVGAWVGLQVLSQSLWAQRANLLAAVDPQDFEARLRSTLQRSGDTLLGHLSRFCAALDRPVHQVVSEALLFTVLGFLVTPRVASVFGIGDGVYWLNGLRTDLGPFADDAPPYLTYALLPGMGTSLTWSILQTLPTPDLESLLIGSDGVMTLADAADRLLPGTAERLGGIEQFWMDDRYFLNPDALRRRLALANGQAFRIDSGGRRLVCEQGLLADDTSLVVLRRRPGSEVHR